VVGFSFAFGVIPPFRVELPSVVRAEVVAALIKVICCTFQDAPAQSDQHASA
jgi:hypothetical protein